MDEGNQQVVGGAVAVPIGLFKVIYVPNSGASVFVADNTADAEVVQIDMHQLEQTTGIRFFPPTSTGFLGRAL